MLTQYTEDSRCIPLNNTLRDYLFEKMHKNKTPTEG